MTKHEEIAEEIISLYLKFGHEDYIGEPVSQMEHMSQSAQLAMRCGGEEEIILAAFFHDIGHLCADSESMGGYGNMSHEKIGAQFLKDRGFSERLTLLVENHVAAKRYLTYKYPEYFSSLSEASKNTLLYQGGRMEKDEAEQFEQNSLFADYILLRRLDELAKEVNVPLIDLNQIKSLIIKHLEATKIVAGHQR